MTFVAKMNAPVFTPFDEQHPHQHFQLCRVVGELFNQEIFLSCPETGLTDELIVTYLAARHGVDPKAPKYSEAKIYWIADEFRTIEILTLDHDRKPTKGGPVYSIYDPVLQMHRLLLPAMFYYTA